MDTPRFFRMFKGLRGECNHNTPTALPLPESGGALPGNGEGGLIIMAVKKFRAGPARSGSGFRSAGFTASVRFSVAL